MATARATAGGRPFATTLTWLALGVAAGAVSATAVLMLVITVMGYGGPPAMPSPRLVEETEPAGIDHSYDGEFTYFVGGGVAVFDCDDDGRPDAYFAGGSNRAALYRNQSPVGGELRFAAVPSQGTDLIDVIGAYPLDIDGDAHLDLAVLRLGENVLLRGRGDCRFERGNETWGFDGANLYSTAFSAKWEGAASLPTLAVGNYLELTELGNMTGVCSNNQVYRAAEAGTSYGSPLELPPSWCTLSLLFSDWDRSGRRDLRVSNDREYTIVGQEQLWRVEPGEAPHLYTEEEGWNKVRVFGMGIASRDLTGDGLPEVFLTNQGDNKLQTLADGREAPNYEDIALDRGVTARTPFTGDIGMPSTAWHPEFADVNNDGWIDLFISKGNVEAMTDYARRDPSNLLLGQSDGTFLESAEEAGILSFSRARGAALADFNLDGLLDLLVVNRRENVKLWRNVGWGYEVSPVPMGNWVAFRLRQAGPNRDAVGAWIEVRADGRTMTRELTVGGGHAGGQLGWVHFGLGEAEEARVRVQWPDGEVGPWLRMDANEFAIVEREAEAVQAWLPPQG